jgi:hypothetical protein
LAPKTINLIGVLLTFISGGKEYLMKAQFFLPSVEGESVEGKPPIQVKFEIPYFTTSGIQVRILTFRLVILTCQNNPKYF